MPSPKLARIVDALVGRAQRIAQADGYRSDCGCTIVDSGRDPDAEQLPCIMISLGERTRTAHVGSTQSRQHTQCDQLATITAYRALDHGEPAIYAGIDLLADIQQAFEGADDALIGLITQIAGGLRFEGDRIFQPETGTNLVAAEVTYAIPHTRTSGDPIDEKRGNSNG